MKKFLIPLLALSLVGCKGDLFNSGETVMAPAAHFKEKGYDVLTSSVVFEEHDSVSVAKFTYYTMNAPPSDPISVGDGLIHEQDSAICILRNKKGDLMGGNEIPLYRNAGGRATIELDKSQDATLTCHVR